MGRIDERLPPIPSATASYITGHAQRVALVGVKGLRKEARPLYFGGGQKFHMRNYGRAFTAQLDHYVVASTDG